MDTAQATLTQTCTTEIETELTGTQKTDKSASIAVKAKLSPSERIKVQSNSQGKVKSTNGNSQKKAQGKRGKNQRLGKLGEDMACIYLSDNGFTIIERNWKCYAGEADIIAVEDGILVFVEVKTRSESYLGLPEYAVTEEKRVRYEKIAICYLEKHKRPSGQLRFDVIAICMTGEQQCLLRHHRDAFGAGVC